MGAFCKYIGIQVAFKAELMAFIQATDLAWHKGWRNLWVELDSLTVVNCVQASEFEPPWVYHTLWSNCKNQIQDMNIHVSHIFREGNQAADKLAKMGLDHSSLKWWNSYPAEISNFLAHDYSSQPNDRFK